MKQSKSAGWVVAWTLLALSLSPAVHSTATWYRGTVTRVALLNTGNTGDFIVTLSGDDLDDCEYGYAYFRTSLLGAEKVKTAYALAVAGLISGRDFGVVIDKGAPGTECDATGMTADLR